MTTINNEVLRLRAKAHRLNGLVEHWGEIDGATWLAPVLQWKEDERGHRSLQRRIRKSTLAYRNPTQQLPTPRSIIGKALDYH
ncbi:hypothetical protein [Caballeronia arationis]|uniref:hypothetical protein n=1 Tax=Caballeronia arationis TaxID=1777142 RepID=UPI001F2F79BE|nr:hypothetical protein [Caballeronia arationis]